MSQPPNLPGLRFIAIPDQYRGHSLLQGTPFFTLPRALLDSVTREVGITRFDSELLVMERALSDAIPDDTPNVGFWRGIPIAYHVFRSCPLPSNNSDLAYPAEAAEKDVVQVRRTFKSLDERLQRTDEVNRGYCGWLMTSRQFLDEHKEILDRWADDISQHGIPVMGPVVRNAKAFPGGATVARGTIRTLLLQFEQFFIRWRLNGMPAPWCPVPFGPNLPVLGLRPVLGHMCHGGTTFYLPDIYPIPSEGEFRNIIEETLRSGKDADHLAEWTEIVRSGNPAKNQISRHARIFKIQHYLRALYRRHRQTLYRRKGALIAAFADFLDVSDATVEQDLRHIARSLDHDWYLLQE